MGKGEAQEPFRILGQKGSYFYIPANTVKSLLKINQSYRELSRKGKVRPVGKLRLVGRGGAPGFKPFLVRGQRYLCILAEDLERLRAVNKAYGTLSKRKRVRAKKRKRVRAKKRKRVKAKAKRRRKAR